MQIVRWTEIFPKGEPLREEEEYYKGLFGGEERKKGHHYCAGHSLGPMHLSPGTHPIPGAVQGGGTEITRQARACPHRVERQRCDRLFEKGLERR